MLVPGFVHNPRTAQVRGEGRRPAPRQAREPIPILRARLTPSYSFGCKRVLPSNEWYPAITQPNVDVVTQGIAEVEAERHRQP